MTFNTASVPIDFAGGIIKPRGAEYRFAALPLEVTGILEDGGLIPHVKKVLGRAVGDRSRCL